MFLKAAVLSLAVMFSSASVAGEFVDNRMTDIRLVMVFRMLDNSIELQHRSFESIRECREAEAFVSEAVSMSNDIVDVGTICLQSVFVDTVKPKA